MSALAQRLSMVLGVDAARGEDALVHAVAALRERSEEHEATIATLLEQRDKARDGRDKAHERVLDLACALECKGLTPADHGSVHVAALRAARGVVDELRRSGAPDGLDVRRRVVWLREQLIAAAAGRDSAIGEANDLRRERETLIAERDEARADHHAERELRREALAEVKRLETLDALSSASEVDRLRATPGLLDRIDDGSPAADGRAVQALLDAHGYPLRKFGPVVRVMRLLGIQGVDLPERGE